MVVRKASLFKEDYFTAKEVAREFGVKVETLREWISQGKIRAIKIGKEYRISQGAIYEYIDEREREAEELRALNRKRTLDPTPKWDLTTCVACGDERVYTTRDNRLDGDVLGPNCRTDEDGDWMRVSDWQRRSSVVWHRISVIRCAEKNAIEVEQVARTDRKRIAWYEVFCCSSCGKPTVVRKAGENENILEYEERLAPACDHEWPGADAYRATLPKRQAEMMDDGDLEDLPF